MAYAYLWTPTAQTTEDAIGLGAGVYTIVATDQFGCVDSAQYTVTEPTALSLGIASQTDATCNGGSNGTATLTVFGGSGNYLFLWNDASAQTSATATGLAAGTYMQRLPMTVHVLPLQQSLLQSQRQLHLLPQPSLLRYALEVQMAALLHLLPEEQEQLLIVGATI